MWLYWWVSYTAGFCRNIWWFCGVEHVVLQCLCSGQQICLNFKQSLVQTNHPREWILAPCVRAVTVWGIQKRSRQLCSFRVNIVAFLCITAIAVDAFLFLLPLLNGRKVRTNYLRLEEMFSREALKMWFTSSLFASHNFECSSLTDCCVLFFLCRPLGKI